MPNTFYPAPTKPKSASTYDYTQSNPALVWTIPHPLNSRPSVTAVSSAGVEVFGDVSYPSPGTTTVVITFSSPISGFAHLV